MWNSSYEHRGQLNWLNSNSSVLFSTQPCSLTKLSSLPLQDILHITHLCKGFLCSVHLQQQRYQVSASYPCPFQITKWNPLIQWPAWGKTPQLFGASGRRNTKELLPSWLFTYCNTIAYLSTSRTVFCGTLFPLNFVSIQKPNRPRNAKFS